MNTLKKMRGYVDGVDIFFGMMAVITVMLLISVLVLIAIDGSKPWKPGVVEQTAIECVPAVEAVEATETTEGVVEQGPYTCTITAKMDDQYLRDLFEANDYLQTLEYGQHRIGDPYPEVPGEETDEGDGIVVDGELTKDGVSITITTEGEVKE